MKNYYLYLNKLYNVQEQTGSYTIEGKRMAIKMLGYTLLYNVDSET